MTATVSHGSVGTVSTRKPLGQQIYAILTTTDHKLIAKPPASDRRSRRRV